ncbi:hypothetical protein [Thiomonas sp. FB-Cd]|uniref:hypothetical protein n=1 Tax=Thiomonas sp. FB-Cd TaxID=1158292 RepID=UPI0018CC4283|nr:hypothetical protein [Thiomonas sp. FB-Cd]
MHLKFRRNQALLYRSTWVPKGAQGNTHGYSRQSYLGSIPLTAAAIPDALQSKLTADELAFVESKICGPARQRAAEEQRAAELCERDPGWRIEEAQRLLGEAADRSAGQPICAAILDRVHRSSTSEPPKTGFFGCAVYKDQGLASVFRGSRVMATM